MNAIVLRQPGFATRFASALANVAAADFLLYRQPQAISFAIVIALAGITVLVTHPAAFRGRTWLPKAALLVAALAPLVENVSVLSALVAIVLLAVLALSIAERLRLAADLSRIGKTVLALFILAPFRLIGDLFRCRRAARRLGGRRLRLAAVAVWIMPVALGAVFLALFGAANPVIDRWLSLIDLWRLLELIEPARVIFWCLALVLLWAVFRPRLPWFFRRPRRIVPRQTEGGKPTEAMPAARTGAGQLFEDVVFGKAAIVRALILFNLMFAVETALDLAYLWGGVALPEGMSYASYAHRGAYPLIVTALLAAVFVLLALKPGSAASGDRQIRVLVYAWIGQNIMLVVSSIFRLDLYVGIYALTYWRVAAFIWMGLVAVGLALIVARIALEKSGKWLSSANLLALSLTLYACCFINFAALIASYNVEHSQEMTGQGVPLDSWYLRELGPAAFPAIDVFLAGRDMAALDQAVAHVANARVADEAHYREAQKNWRAWSFRDWRLMRYLNSRIAKEGR